MRIEVPEVPRYEAPYDLVRRLRASIAVLGPLLARTGHAKVSLPGGDAIGSRGLDMHLQGLRELGVVSRIEHGYVVAEAPNGLVGRNIALEFPSVGATENLLMAAVLAQGTTVIDNIAREPEIADLCRMLSAMGAQIDGIGTAALTVHGVETLSPVTHETVPDRIVAGTWAFATAIAGGDLESPGRWSTIWALCSTSSARPERACAPPGQGSGYRWTDDLTASMCEPCPIRDSRPTCNRSRWLSMPSLAVPQ